MDIASVCGSSILAELEFGELAFVEGRNPVKNPEKKASEQGKNQQQTQLLE